MRRLLIILGVAAMLAAPLAEARPNVTPRLGIYYCYYGFAGWDLQLRSGGRYVQGYADRGNTRIKDVIGKGTFRMSGGRITFRTGPLKKFTGTAKTRKTFQLGLRGARYASYDCELSR